MACRNCGYDYCICDLQNVPYAEQIRQLKNRIAEIEAERDKYKLALEKIARQKRVYPYAVRGHNCDYKNEVQSKIDIARIALKGEGQ